MTIRQSAAYVEVLVAGERRTVAAVRSEALVVGEKNTVAAVRAEALTAGNRNTLGALRVELLTGPPEDFSLVGKINKFVKRTKKEFTALSKQIADMTPRLIPSGGTSGQVLKKNGSADYAVYWGADNAGGGGSTIDDRRYVPATTDVSIDEFDDKVLDPAWVRADGTQAPAGYLTWIEDAHQLSAQHTASADSNEGLHAILRPMTAMSVGDAFITAFTMYGHPTASYVMGGLVLATGASHGAGKQLINLNYTEAGGNASSDLRAFQNFGSQVGSGAATLLPGTGMLTYTRLVLTAANTYRVDTSPNGAAWVIGATYVWTEIPTHVGFLSSNWGQTRAGVVGYEFLRRASGVT